MKNGEARGSEERAGARFRKRSDVKKNEEVERHKFCRGGAKEKERKKETEAQENSQPLWRFLAAASCSSQG